MNQQTDFVLLDVLLADLCACEDHLATVAGTDKEEAVKQDRKEIIRQINAALPHDE